MKWPIASKSVVLVLVLASTLTAPARAAAPSNAPSPAPSRPTLDTPFNSGTTPATGGSNVPSPFVQAGGITWARGSGVGIIPGAARVKIEAATLMTDPVGTRTWLGQQGLQPKGDEIGLIIGPRASWSALVTLLPYTNATLRELSARLTELGPAVLASLNEAAPGTTGTNGARMKWDVEPRLGPDDTTLEWSLTHEVTNRLCARPGAAFATARGLIVLRFFGPDITSADVCFRFLRGVSLTHPPREPFSAPPDVALLTRVVWDPRALDFHHAWLTALTAPARTPGQAPEPAVSARPKVRYELPPPAPIKREFTEDDWFVVGLLGLVVVLVLGIALGTRQRLPHLKGKRRSRRPAQAVAEEARPSGVTLAALGVTPPTGEADLSAPSSIDAAERDADVVTTAASIESTSAR